MCFHGKEKTFFLDLVGDAYDGSNALVPDNDPLDNCSSESHGIHINYSSFLCLRIFFPGTHVSGIIAANTTGITQNIFIPFTPFIGVAPQVTLGMCKFTGFELFKIHISSSWSKRSCVWM